MCASKRERIVDSDCSSARGRGSDRKEAREGVKDPSEREAHREAIVSRTRSSSDHAASLGVRGAGAVNEVLCEAACEGAVEMEALSSTSMSC